MSRTVKILVCTVLLLGILSGTAFAEGKPALPGYLLAILLGFGTGHFYIEVDGLPLLVTELVGLGFGVVGTILATVAAAQFLTAPTISGLTTIAVWTVISGVGFGIYGIARLVEIIGIFIETDKQQKAGVVATASLEPMFELRPDMVSAGVRLRY